MKVLESVRPGGMTRRDTLKLSGLAVFGLAMGGSAKPEPDACEGSCYPTRHKTDRYKYAEQLDRFYPVDELRHPTPLDADEMRITFLGSAIPMPRRAQQMMSIFVEVGWKDGKPLDSFVFDCGSGVASNYNAMGIGFARMDKVFITHLHGDHMSDLTHIYCFGPSGDRRSPLYVFGPSASNVESPLGSDVTYDDGTVAFCENLRSALRWHSESFSFQSTSYVDHPSPATVKADWGLPVLPVPVGDDPAWDGFALIPIELDWTKRGVADDGSPVDDNVAYHSARSGVKITHFPVVHCRKGSIGYKLEWTIPGTDTVLSMIYTSDTRPETISVEQARNWGKGVDVFVHEMIVPPEVWAMKMLGLDEPGTGDLWEAVLEDVRRVQDSSHTPQGAFGYLLSQVTPRPRLTVATHFPVADDTVACALQSIRRHVPDIAWSKKYDPVHKNITWSTDLMVIRVWDREIQQLLGVVSDYAFSPSPQIAGELAPPKYAEPEDQIDLTNVILPGDDTYCPTGY
jgi:ribonuclease Z